MRQGMKIPSVGPGILFRLVFFSPLQGSESGVDGGMVVSFRKLGSRKPPCSVGEDECDFRYVDFEMLLR